MEIFLERSSEITLWKSPRQGRKHFRLENQNLEATEKTSFQKPRSLNISKGGDLRGVRFSSPEPRTIKTTNKDGSNKTPIRFVEEDTNIQAKEEEDMVRLNKNTHLRIASDGALVLEEDLKLVHFIVK